MLVTFFRLSEQERKEHYLAKSTSDIFKRKKLAIGTAHMAVLEDDGTVSAYGDNSRGQCEVAAWRDMQKIAAGDFHTVGLKKDGTVLAAGDNTYGQCNVGEWSGVAELFAERNLTTAFTQDGIMLVAAAKPEEVQSKNGVKRVRAEFNGSLLPEILQYMFEVMESERDIAIVCPLKIWAECCGEDSFLKKLAACRSRSTHNIVALTSSVDASENDVYFRNPAYELNATAEAAEPFFFNEKLFPQMVSKFSNGFSSTPKLVHTYDALQEVFADRMLVLNDLSYEKLRTAVKYIFMRRSGGSFYYSPDLYAAVIWAWYENPGFRDKYAFLRLPANPFRSMRIITDYIGHYNITGIADVIIRQEQAWQVREFLARWQCAEKCPSIIYENNDAQDNHCSAIIEMMIAYKKTMKRHEAILGDAGAAQMNRVMLFFSNPSYTSCYNKVKLPHERFAEEENKTAITQMLGKLREKTEWNSWEEGAMLLLYTLFEQCYRQSKAMCSIDQYNELGKSVFEKALQAMQYCMYRAEDVYGSMDELKLAAKRANQFVMEAQSVLSSGNNKKIRDYVILKGVS